MVMVQCYFSFSSAVALLSLLGAALAGSATEDNTCSTSNDKIDPSTHKFTSDCDDRTYCSPSPPQSNQNSSSNFTSSLPSSVAASNTTFTGICTKRLCRRDEFPFGFLPNEPIPPLCLHGSFCPDNGSGCRPVLQVGQPCDMDRDYQCSPAKNWFSTASEWNYNGSVCLMSTCMYANTTIGLSCTLERTTYTGYNRDNAAYSLTISRDNCLSSWPKLYCNPSTLVCEKMKDLGTFCASNRECRSQYCSTSTNICAESPGTPARVLPWQYVLTILSILGAVIVICVFLALSHKRQRMEKYYELLEYYHEQTSLRASIISLHGAAAQRLEGGNENEKLHYL